MQTLILFWSNCVTRFALVSFLFLPTLFTANYAHAQCRPGDILIGEDADNYYCMERAKFEGSLVQKYGSEFCRAKLKVTADQKAIQEMGFELTASRFEMFGDVAQKQKDEFEKKVYGAMLNYGLDTTVTLAKEAKSLNPWNVNNTANWLKDHHFGNKTLIAKLRWVASQKDKPAMAAAYEKFVEDVKSAKDDWDTGSETTKDPENSDLTLMVGALKVLQGNEEAGLIITAGEMSENLAYLVYLSGQVDQLARISDENLARLQPLTKRLRGHVDDMVKAKRAWQSEAQSTLGMPVSASATPECNH